MIPPFCMIYWSVPPAICNGFAVAKFAAEGC